MFGCSLENLGQRIAISILVMWISGNIAFCYAEWRNQTKGKDLVEIQVEICNDSELRKVHSAFSGECHEAKMKLSKMNPFIDAVRTVFGHNVEGIIMLFSAVVNSWLVMFSVGLPTGLFFYSVIRKCSKSYKDSKSRRKFEAIEKERQEAYLEQLALDNTYIYRVNPDRTTQPRKKISNEAYLLPSTTTE